jgi:hypothetical protein
MRRIALAAISTLSFVGGLATPGTASASHDPTGAPFAEDFVTGTGVQPEETCTPSTCFRIVLVFDAHSGPSGENPAGTVRIDVQGTTGTSTFATGQVTCLDVRGNRATVGARFGFGGLVLGVEDNDGAGQDRLGTLAVGGPPPSACPALPSTALPPIFAGDLTVHDAVPLPTSKAHCKNGGWRNFSGFKSQGECVALVERGPR